MYKYFNNVLQQSTNGVSSLLHHQFLGKSEIEEWIIFFKLGDKIPNLNCTIKYLIIKIPCVVPSKYGSIPLKERNIPSVALLGNFLWNSVHRFFNFSIRKSLVVQSVIHITISIKYIFVHLYDDYQIVLVLPNNNRTHSKTL